MRSLVLETYGRLGGEGNKFVRDLVTTAAGNRAVQPTRCWTMAGPAGAGVDVYGHLGEGFARWERPTSAALLLQAEQSVSFFLSIGLAVTRLSCELTSDRDREQRQTHRHTVTPTDTDTDTDPKARTSGDTDETAL